MGETEKIEKFRNVQLLTTRFVFYYFSINNSLTFISPLLFNAAKIRISFMNEHLVIVNK